MAVSKLELNNFVAKQMTPEEEFKQSVLEYKLTGEVTLHSKRYLRRIKRHILREEIIEENPDFIDYSLHHFLPAHYFKNLEFDSDILIPLNYDLHCKLHDIFPLAILCFMPIECILFVLEEKRGLI